HPLPSAALGNTHALLVLWDEAGIMQSSRAVPAAALPDLLYQYRDRNFLLAASAEALPDYVRERLRLSRDAGLRVVLGTLMGNFELLPLQQVDEDLVVESPACERLVNTILSSVEEGGEQRFFEQYCQFVEQPLDYLDTREG